MIGIFLEPNKQLKKSLLNGKNLKKKNIKGKFINHPPHSTIFLQIFETKKLFSVLEKTLQILINLK